MLRWSASVYGVEDWEELVVEFEDTRTESEISHL